MAVAFPVGIGMALVIGSVLNYLITPKGNPLLLFGGVALVCVAIVLDALAYRQLTPDAKASKKGIILSLLGGFGMGLFYPFVAKGISGENHLGPYTVACVFGLGILASNIPANYIVMRRPVAGPPVSLADYFAGAARLHFWGILGGAFWAVGTLSNFVASYAAMVGPATSYALGQGATMVGAIWGVFVWKEFAGAGTSTKRLLAHDVRLLYHRIGLRGAGAGGEVENEVESRELKVKSQIHRGNSMKSITALMATHSFDRLLLRSGRHACENPRDPRHRHRHRY